MLILASVARCLRRRACGTEVFRLMGASVDVASMGKFVSGPKSVQSPFQCDRESLRMSLFLGYATIRSHIGNKKRY